MITKDYFEKKLKKHETLTLYSADNVSLTVSKKYYLSAEHNDQMHFDMDCADLEKYCDRMGLTLNPTKDH